MRISATGTQHIRMTEAGPKRTAAGPGNALRSESLCLGSHPASFNRLDFDLFESVKSFSFFNGAAGSFSSGSLTINTGTQSQDAGLTITLKQKDTVDFLQLRYDLNITSGSGPLLVQCISSSPDGDYKKDTILYTSSIPKDKHEIFISVPLGTDKLNFIMPGASQFDLNIKKSLCHFSTNTKKTDDDLAEYFYKSYEDYQASLLRRYLETKFDLVVRLIDSAPDTLRLGPSAYARLYELGYGTLIDKLAAEYHSKGFTNNSSLIFETVLSKIEWSRWNREIVLGALAYYGDCFPLVISLHSGDREICLAAVKRKGAYYDLLSDIFKNDKDIALATVTSDHTYFDRLPDVLKEDKDIVLAVVSQDYTYFDRISQGLQEDIDIARAAILQNYTYFGRVCEALRDNKELALAAVKTDGRALQYASGRLRDDKGVVLAALSSGKLSAPMAFQYASDRLRDDYDVALAAALLDTSTMAFSSARLLDMGQFIISASFSAKDSVKAIKYASQRLRYDTGFIMQLLDATEERSIIENVPSDLKATDGFQMELVKLSIPSISVIHSPLRGEAYLKVLNKMVSAMSVLKIGSYKNFFNSRDAIRQRYSVSAPAVRMELEEILGKDYFKDIEEAGRPISVVILPDSDYNKAAFNYPETNSQMLPLKAKYQRLFYDFSSDREFSSVMQEDLLSRGLKVSFMLISGHGEPDRTKWGDWTMTVEDLEQTLGKQRAAEIYASLIRGGYLDQNGTLTNKISQFYVDAAPISAGIDGCALPGKTLAIQKELVQRNWLYLTDYPLLSKNFRDMCLSGMLAPEAFGLDHLDPSFDEEAIFAALRSVLEQQHSSLTLDISMTADENRRIEDLFLTVIDRSYMDVNDRFLRTELCDLMGSEGMVAFWSCSVGSYKNGTTEWIDNNVEFAHSIWPNAWTIGAQYETRGTQVSTANGIVQTVLFAPPESTIIPPSIDTVTGWCSPEKAPSAPADITISNYPNPFHNGTNIVYSAAEASNGAEIKIFNMLGKQIDSLAVKESSGMIYWDSASAPAGSYFAVLTANGQSYRSKVMSLMR